MNVNFVIAVISAPSKETTSVHTTTVKSRAIDADDAYSEAERLKTALLDDLPYGTSIAVTWVRAPF